MYDRLLQFLSAQWLIHVDSAFTYLPVLVSILNGAKLNHEDFKEKGQKPYCINPAASSEVNPVGGWDLESEDIPENSIAVIPIQGVLYSEKSARIKLFTELANQNPKVNAILYTINTPGGMVYMTDITAASIKASKKPTIGYVQNMVASAGMWLASAMDYRIASSPLDKAGSVGVMSSFMDIDNMLKTKLNINIHEFYATKSTNKNIEYRNLMKNKDDKLIIENLDYINDFFHKAIQQNLGIKENSPVLTGSLYFAQEAIKLGLINEINDLNYAIELTNERGYKSKLNNFLT